MYFKFILPLSSLNVLSKEIAALSNVCGILKINSEFDCK